MRSLLASYYGKKRAVKKEKRTPDQRRDQSRGGLKAEKPEHEMMVATTMNASREHVVEKTQQQQQQQQQCSHFDTSHFKYIDDNDTDTMSMAGQANQDNIVLERSAPSPRLSPFQERRRHHYLFVCLFVGTLLRCVLSFVLPFSLYSHSCFCFNWSSSSLVACECSYTLDCSDFKTALTSASVHSLVFLFRSLYMYRCRYTSVLLYTFLTR